MSDGKGRRRLRLWTCINRPWETKCQKNRSAVIRMARQGDVTPSEFKRMVSGLGKKRPGSKKRKRSGSKKRKRSGSKKRKQ
jgi:hypothetical protein